MMTKKLQEAIEAFLSQPVKIQQGYERARASKPDAQAFERLIHEIAKAKWKESYDGFLPVEVHCVNRSTHEALHYQALPYDEKNDDFSIRMQIATTNLSLASNEVDRTWRDQEAKIRREKAIQEGRYCHLHGSYQKANEPCPGCKKK